MTSITTQLTITRPADIVVTLVLSATDVKVSYLDPDEANAVLKIVRVAIGDEGAVELNLTAGTPTEKDA